jgi:tetratricopeptide (TPR) repeat protein
LLIVFTPNFLFPKKNIVTEENENLEIVKTEYDLGKQYFERGRYREAIEHLETASANVELNSLLGGEVHIWLVTAYHAAEKQDEAIALCRRLTRHTNLTTRQQAKRLLAILEAPQLRTRPEWVVSIPELDNLGESDFKDRRGSSSVSTTVKSPPPKRPELEPVDLSQVNTKDNQFIWVALIATLLTVGGLIWFS